MLHVFCTNYCNLPLMLTGEWGLAHYLCCLFAFWCVCPIAFLLTLLFFLLCTLQFACGKIGDGGRFFLSSHQIIWRCIHTSKTGCTFKIHLGIWSTSGASTLHTWFHPIHIIKTTIPSNFDYIFYKFPRRLTGYQTSLVLCTSVLWMSAAKA
jgi:hypothetical protein